MKTINQFEKEYFFLSNFFESWVIHDGLVYQSNEAAFQAAKCAFTEDRYQFTKLNPSQAKKLGRRVKLRPDWEDVKVDVMRQLLLTKFLLHADLGNLLLETEDAKLVEGNTWNDRFWGVDANTGIGENMLGELLMEVRDYLKMIRR